ncbi:hypothetical protein Csa_008595 [Cucumis sativus]|uniref:Uncharacterized protein n=1 Tax=Cucumis sativus TaxID=3659 RepID=A0A0A0KPT5_CUCSA|nr:hypothetical protein Csa_008595 [Cucumis sativus]
MDSRGGPEHLEASKQERKVRIDKSLVGRRPFTKILAEKTALIYEQRVEDGLVAVAGNGREQAKELMWPS